MLKKAHAKICLWASSADEGFEGAMSQSLWCYGQRGFLRGSTRRPPKEYKLAATHMHDRGKEDLARRCAVSRQAVDFFLPEPEPKRPPAVGTAIGFARSPRSVASPFLSNMSSPKDTSLLYYFLRKRPSLVVEWTGRSGDSATILSESIKGKLFVVRLWTSSGIESTSTSRLRLCNYLNDINHTLA